MKRRRQYRSSAYEWSLEWRKRSENTKSNIRWSKPLALSRCSCVAAVLAPDLSTSTSTSTIGIVIVGRYCMERDPSHCTFAGRLENLIPKQALPIDGSTFAATMIASYQPSCSTGVKALKGHRRMHQDCIRLRTTHNTGVYASSNLSRNVRSSAAGICTRCLFSG
jgi:hypothetical protein